MRHVLKEPPVEVWIDAEGDYLEVVFSRRRGYFRETPDDRVMVRADEQGKIIGFSVLGFSTMKGASLKLALGRRGKASVRPDGRGT